MKKFTQFFGILGVVLLGFALVGGFILGFDVALNTPLILIHLVGGVLLLLSWFFATGIKSVSMAGEVVSGRAARFGYSSIFFVVVFVGLFGVVNWFANRYNEEWDLTEQGAYSLAPQSKEILKSLKRPLKIIGLKGATSGQNGQASEQTKELLDLYANANRSMITTDQFDPQAKPHLVDKYGFKQGNQIYVAYGEDDSPTKGVVRINDINEEALTNAILKLQKGESKKVYYITGHDEPSITSENPDGAKKLAEAIKDEHLTLEELFIGDKGEIPADAAAVLVVSPKKPFAASERDLLIKYGDNGGKLVLLTDPRTTSDLSEIAKHFKIDVGNNVILDQVQRLFSGPAIGAQPAVRTYGEHPITKEFDKNAVTIFNIASTVTPNSAEVSSEGKGKDGASYVELLKTSGSAWGESNIDALFADEPAAEFNEGSDARGPVSIGVVYEKEISDSATDAQSPQKVGDEAKPESKKVSRVVVIGDSDWILNANLPVYANRDLILNTVGWVAGEETGLSIRPRSIRESLAPIGESDFLKILAASFLVPELILLSGLFVWWRRKTAYA